MPVGLFSTRGEVDVRAGQLARALRTSLVEIGDFKLWLDTQTDPQLTTDFGYTAGEIAAYRSSYTDLDKMRQIYLGLATQSPAYDFRTFAKLLA